MKKIMGFLFTLLLITNTVFAFPNEPEGFRGLKWGDTIEKFKTVCTITKLQNDVEATATKENYSLYQVNLDNKKLSTLHLEDYGFYAFKDNRFIGVILKSKNFKSLTDFRQVESNFFESLNILYGKHNRYHDNHDSPVSKKICTYIWDDNGKSIIIVHSVTNSYNNGANSIEIDIFDRNHYYDFCSIAFYQKEDAKKQGW